MKIQSIQLIIDNCGTVTFPYKSKLSDWYSEIKLGYLKSKGCYYICLDNDYTHYDDLSEAYNKFIKIALTNIGYKFSMYAKHQLKINSNWDFEIDDLNKKELKKFEIEINQWFETYKNSLATG